jgi:hypothetical protein
VRSLEQSADLALTISTVATVGELHHPWWPCPLEMCCCTSAVCCCASLPLAHTVLVTAAAQPAAPSDCADSPAVTGLSAALVAAPAAAFRQALAGCPTAATRTLLQHVGVSAWPVAAILWVLAVGCPCYLAL